MDNPNRFKRRGERKVLAKKGKRYEEGETEKEWVLAKKGID